MTGRSKPSLFSETAIRSFLTPSHQCFKDRWFHGRRERSRGARVERKGRSDEESTLSQSRRVVTDDRRNPARRQDVQARRARAPALGTPRLPQAAGPQRRGRLTSRTFPPASLLPETKGRSSGPSSVQAQRRHRTVTKPLVPSSDALGRG